MTNTNIHIPEEHPAVTGAIMGLLTTAVIVLTGFLSVAQFLAVG